jgi:hypothetical protein
MASKKDEAKSDTKIKSGNSDFESAVQKDNSNKDFKTDTTTRTTSTTTPTASTTYTARSDPSFATAATSNTSDSRTTIVSDDNSRQYSQAADRAIDDTRENIRKTTDEARKEIPRYTQAVNEYQEQSTQAIREIADSFLESQKEIIRSFQSALSPLIESVYEKNWMMSPTRMADFYAAIISNMTNNMIAATRISNNMIFAGIEAFKNSVQQAKDTAKESSRIGINAARNFERTTQESTNENKSYDTRTTKNEQYKNY